MFRQTAVIASILLGAFTQHALAVDETRDPELNAKLFTANTQLDRKVLLPSNSDWLFDFNEQQPYYTFAPGGVVNMNAATFPAAKGNGMTSMSHMPPPGKARRRASVLCFVQPS